MDRIETMKAFVAVASEGNFIRAAQKLNISSQLVSKYVSQLETHLGARLFNRTTRKVSLTEEGLQCLQHAKQILESVENMEGHFGQLKSAVTGLLRISAPTSFATLHLAPLICDFKKKYPAVGIHLQLNDRKIDVIEEGFDLAIRIGNLKSSSLIAKKIAPIRMVMCASADYLKMNGTPKSPDDLNPDHYLSYSYMNYDQTQSELIRFLKFANHKQSLPISANNGEVLVAAAISGKGYVLQPTFIAGEALKGGKLIHILQAYELEPIGLYLVYPHRQLMAPKLRAFIDFCEDYYGDSPYWDKFDSQ